MFELKIENHNGDILDFNDTAFTVSEIQGLNPPNANINTSEIALVDGAKYNSSKMSMRSLNIVFYIEFEAAKNRIKIYNVLKSKEYVKITYTGEYRDVFVEGYVEGINIDYFAMKQMVTVSILCPSPYFKEAQSIINGASKIVPMFTFPFAIAANEKKPLSYIDSLGSTVVINDGDVKCGITIEVYSRNPVANIKIFNYVTAEYMGLDMTTEIGDVVTICTTQGSKGITLLRNGTKTNIFNSLSKGSTWLQLDPGENIFVYEADGISVNYADVRYIHNNLYEGV